MTAGPLAGTGGLGLTGLSLPRGCGHTRRAEDHPQTPRRANSLWHLLSALITGQDCVSRIGINFKILLNSASVFLYLQ